jgi:hypothetical protein
VGAGASFGVVCGRAMLAEPWVVRNKTAKSILDVRIALAHASTFHVRCFMR